jgi:hypothetical protein
VAQRSGRLRIVLSGMIAGVPRQGGATWAVLQYLVGFRQLGHDVLLVEQCEQASLEPQGARLADSENASYFRGVMADFGLEQESALLLAGSEETVGVDYSRLRRLSDAADVLVNISGTLTDERLMDRIAARAYLDVDPAFTQLWHATGTDMRFAGHTHFVTIGQALDGPDCPIPSNGIRWIPTVPPVVLAHWERAEHVSDDSFTTVGNWRSYGSIEYKGIHYGQRAHSMRQLISLPALTDASFTLALAIHPGDEKDLAALEQNGWRLVDAAQVAGTPAQYRRFIQASRAELGIAKSGYVTSRCGWFSDRSACYLASGRPVVAQETGFSRFLPTGEGLFAFETSDQAIASIDELKANYPRHAGAARDLAEEHFDSDRVLEELLEKIGGSSE